MHRGAFAGDLKEVRIALNHGADVNAQYHFQGDTAMMLAAKGGHAHIIAELARCKADPNLMCRQGTPALIHAAEHNNTDAILALLDAGANVDARDKRGCVRSSSIRTKTADETHP